MLSLKLMIKAALKSFRGLHTFILELVSETEGRIFLAGLYLIMIICLFFLQGSLENWKITVFLAGPLGMLLFIWGVVTMVEYITSQPQAK